MNLALLHPSGLLGADLVEALGRRRELWQQVRLLTDDDDEAGTLTEVGGSAAMVTKLESGDLDRADVAFFCGNIEQSRPLLADLPAGITAILLGRDAAPEDGHPVVAGVNLEAAQRGQTLLCPHPGTVLLAHLLHPIRELGPAEVTATLLQPVSVHSRAALDEVFEQTRSILAFDPNPRREIFPVQMAFNVTPDLWPSDHLGDHLRTVLGWPGPQEGPLLATRILQAGVFHSYGASVHVRLTQDPGPERLHEMLAEHPQTDPAVDPEYLGMIDAAAREEVVLGSVERSESGGYWIWAVMDNLTCGGASNAVHVLEAVQDQYVH